MENLIFTATLKSPIIAQGYLTFDSLLAAVLFDRCGDVDEAHTTVPIKCTDSLFHASAAIVDPAAGGSWSIAASLRADHDLDPDLFPKNRNGRVYRKMDRKRRRDFGNVMSSYRTIHTPNVRWICTGDGEQIADLLGDLPFIGKKRAQGFGEVSGWDVEKTDLDPLLDEIGAPRRPIPTHMFTGDKSLPKQDVAWKASVRGKAPKRSTSFERRLADVHSQNDWTNIHCGPTINSILKNSFCAVTADQFRPGRGHRSE